MINCKKGHELCYVAFCAHGLHSVFRSPFTHPAHLWWVLPSTVLWKLRSNMHHPWLMRASTVFHLLIFVLALFFEHGESYLLPAPHERFYHQDIVVGIWPKHLLQQTSTFGKKASFHRFFQDLPIKVIRLAILSTRLVKWLKISLVLHGRCGSF